MILYNEIPVFKYKKYEPYFHVNCESQLYYYSKLWKCYCMNHKGKTINVVVII